MNLLKNLINNLGYVVIIALIISDLSGVKKIMQRDEFRKRDLAILSLAFAIFGIIGTYSGTDVYGAIANTRIIGVMAGGILCGPVVGIVSGTIAGIHRFTYDIGGITSIPCAIATILAGLISALLYKRGNNYNKWFYGFLGGFIMESIEMLLILLISKPYESAVSIVKSIYLPMSLTNAFGISILILLIQKIFKEKEQIAATQAHLALEIANKTLPFFREVTSESLRKICSIIRESTNAAAVSITDTTKVLAHIGLGSDHHRAGSPILTTATKEVIANGKMNILNCAEEIQCFSKYCPLKSAIIVPLKENEEVIGTLKLYYSIENGISYTTESLAIGLSQLISTQLEISKVGQLKDMATKSEIKALQAQINPHFLFNALNTIVSFLRFNPNKARELIVNLSNYLRYNIENSSTFVEISKELEQVKAYVQIEKARFGDKLKVSYEIDETINIKIPSLIIQPLVENSIKHGILEGSGCGNVKITVKQYDSKHTIVIIEDDGVGISPHIVEAIKTNTIQENKIGLSNVNNRLKHIYGKGLTIERLHKGTKISFLINDKEKGG